jgi:hypothetical protein
VASYNGIQGRQPGSIRRTPETPLPGPAPAQGPLAIRHLFVAIRHLFLVIRQLFLAVPHFGSARLSPRDLSVIDFSNRVADW